MNEERAGRTWPQEASLHLGCNRAPAPLGQAGSLLGIRFLPQEGVWAPGLSSVKSYILTEKIHFNRNTSSTA